MNVKWCVQKSLSIFLRRLTETFLQKVNLYKHSTKANSEDPDQTPHDAMSGLHLHCLLTENYIKFGEKNIS